MLPTVTHVTASHGAPAPWLSSMPRPLRLSVTTETASRYSKNMLCLPFTLPAAEGNATCVFAVTLRQLRVRPFRFGDRRSAQHAYTQFHTGIEGNVCSSHAGLYAVRLWGFTDCFACRQSWDRRAWTTCCDRVRGEDLDPAEDGDHVPRGCGIHQPAGQLGLDGARHAALLLRPRRVLQLLRVTFGLGLGLGLGVGFGSYGMPSQGRVAADHTHKVTLFADEDMNEGNSSTHRLFHGDSHFH